jgi:hypothetical protein
MINELSVIELYQLFTLSVAFGVLIADMFNMLLSGIFSLSFNLIITYLENRPKNIKLKDGGYKR